MLDDTIERARVLVFDTDPTRAEALSDRLRFLNYDPVIAGHGNDVPPDTDGSVAALIGNLVSGKTVHRRFQQLKSARPDLPLLVMPSNGSAVDTTPDTRPAWHLDEPVNRAQLSQLLRRAERYQGKERRQRLTGNSYSMRKVRRAIEQVADFDTNVLVTGESGTGKELVARTIHELSDRCDRPFVPINCGAIPADLLESELFGHEKGAFSGAISSRIGRFELAEGGTLFLDEIGDMSLPMQVKLLRVLQERCFERVGSNRTRTCNVRIIAATHRDLPAAVKSGDFREDLYYRLNVFPIEMPPLCKRRSDLPQLLDELLIQHQGNDQGNGKRRLRVSPDALSALAGYSWPGNVRELSNLVERLAILCPSSEIGLADLPRKYRQVENGSEAQLDAPEVPAAAGISLDLKSHLMQVEQDLIRQAMQESGGVVAKAARLLKMQRTTLVEKLSRIPLTPANP